MSKGSFFFFFLFTLNRAKEMVIFDRKKCSLCCTLICCWTGFFMTAGSFLLSQDEVFIDFLFLPYKPTKPN